MPWALGDAGVTLHPTIDSNLLRAEDCVYLTDAPGEPENPAFGAICDPAIPFRRVMLNGHRPGTIAARDLLLTDLSSPSPGGTPFVSRTAAVTMAKVNSFGYQFVVPAGAGRELWLHWNLTQRVDAERATLHSIEPLGEDAFLQLLMKDTQVRAPPGSGGGCLASCTLPCSDLHSVMLVLAVLSEATCGRALQSVPLADTVAGNAPDTDDGVVFHFLARPRYLPTFVLIVPSASCRLTAAST